MYPIVDYIKSGEKMKELFKEAGMSVKEIQEYLHLSCPQPIYRWFKGKTLPTVNHLYALSHLLGVHMEELLVMQSQKIFLYDLERGNERKKKKRMQQYSKYMGWAV